MESLVNSSVCIDWVQMACDQELEKSKRKVENLVSYSDYEDES